MSSTKKKPAVELFSEAFDRLKNNEPINLPIDSAVTQNNVAREAGRDPSALRADRYPELLHKIQTYIGSKKKETKRNKLSPRNRSRTLEKRLIDCKRERDRLLSICHSQQNLIEELKGKIDNHKGNKVVEFIQKEH